MANRRVRLYEGPENSTVIGFSAGAIPSDKESLYSFLDEHGYESHPYDESSIYNDSEEKSGEYANIIRTMGSVSCWHVGIQPPFKDEHLPDFTEWCRTNVDTSHNSGYLIDNRIIPPYTPQNMILSDGVKLSGWWN